MLVKSERENFWVLNWLDEFMAGHKGFICGGCFKNIFNQDKVKDIDIFFNSQEDFDDAIKYFDSMTPGYQYDDKKSEEYLFVYENDNVKAYKHKETGIRLELCCKVFGTVEKILGNFDFTITKFAYYKEVADEMPFAPFESSDPVHEIEEIPSTHIEYKILMDDKFFEHLHMKRLVADDKISYPMSTFERAFRYAKYGYFPCKETKMKIVSALRDLTDEQILLSDSLYDGMD